MQDLNFDVVESKLRQGVDNVIILPYWCGRTIRLFSIGEYVYEAYLSYYNKSVDEITQEDIDSIDAEDFYRFLYEFFREDVDDDDFDEEITLSDIEDM